MTIKATFLVRRHPSMTYDEFSDYWGNVHAKLARENAAATGMRRYVQVRRAQDPLIDLIAAGRNTQLGTYDGIAEATWDSLDEMKRIAQNSGDVAEMLLADERRFIDLPNSLIWFGTERVQIER